MEDFVELNLYLRDRCPRVPTLFLYSSGDALIPAAQVKSFQKIWKERGIEVSEHAFGDDIEHVAGFYIHPEKYKALLKKFIGF